MLKLRQSESSAYFVACQAYRVLHRVTFGARS